MQNLFSEFSESDKSLKYELRGNLKVVFATQKISNWGIPFNWDHFLVTDFNKFSKNYSGYLHYHILYII